MKTTRKVTDEDVIAILARVRKFAGTPVEPLQTSMEDDLSLECPAMLLEPVEIDFDALPPTPMQRVDPAVPITGTRKVTIRIPNRIIALCKGRARLTGTKYQTLIIRILNTASREWAI